MNTEENEIINIPIPKIISEKNDSGKKAEKGFTLDSKKKASIFAISFIIISFFAGFYIGKENPNLFGNMFFESSYIDFDLSVINDGQYHINIENIKSSHELMNSSYNIINERINESGWFNFIIVNTQTINIKIDANYLKLDGNNTIYVKLTDALNFTMIKSITFNC